MVAAASVGVVFEVEAFEVGVFAVVLTLLAFAAAFVVMAFAAAAFMAVAFGAVGDPYNQSVYQGSAGYTDQLLVGCEANLPISSNFGGVETP